MINVEATKILLEYSTQLKQEILDLRKQACDKAAIVRAIEKTITPEDVCELENYDKLQEAYSLKNVAKYIFNKD